MFNDPNRMSVGACKKPLKYSTFESWDCLRELFVHAHEITVANSREMSICCLCASFVNVLPSLSSTQDLNDNVCASCRPSQPFGSSTTPDDEAVPASLAGVAANIELAEKQSCYWAVFHFQSVQY
jgi:hypothetical protein